MNSTARHASCVCIFLLTEVCFREGCWKRGAGSEGEHAAALPESPQSKGRPRVRASACPHGLASWICCRTWQFLLVQKVKQYLWTVLICIPLIMNLNIIFENYLFISFFIFNFSIGLLHIYQFLLILPMSWLFSPSQPAVIKLCDDVFCHALSKSQFLLLAFQSPLQKVFSYIKIKEECIYAFV